MSKKIKKELILEGLDCANCASKIETKVNEIDGVTSASMNFVTKTLTIESEDHSRIDEILKKANEIVKKMEPHVIVKEKIINKGANKTLLLIGLG
jgi:Zn2+/Cd2+-exporting ATPase